MKLKLLSAAAAVTLFASPASAAIINLSGEVNANLNTYFNGGVYPPNGGPITIGGVPFNLDSLPTGGTGVIQTSASSTTPFVIPVNLFGVTGLYSIANSAFGAAGFTAGQLVFNGSGGATFTYLFTEGDNIRDHATTSFNDLAPNIFATHDFGSGDHLDVQKILLPAAFGSQTLTNIDFSYTGNGVAGDGVAFLAALTTVSAVPEPSTWIMMILGFGGIGLMARRKSRASLARA